MNYAGAYSPSYQQPSYYDPQQAAQMQGYVDPQLAAYYAQQQAYAPLAQVWPQDYASTGQAVVPGTPGGAPAVVAPTTPASPSPFSAAFWKLPTLGIPRWGWAAGAGALTGIYLAWHEGLFGGGSAPTSSTRTTTRRTSTGGSRSRAASRDPARSSAMPWMSSGGGSGKKKKRSGGSNAAWSAGGWPSSSTSSGRDPARTSSKRRGKRRKSRRKAR